MSGRIEVTLEIRKGHRDFTKESGFQTMIFKCYGEEGGMVTINPSKEDIAKLIEDILNCGLEQNKRMPELKTDFRERYRSIIDGALGKPPKLL